MAAQARAGVWGPQLRAIWVHSLLTLGQRTMLPREAGRLPGSLVGGQLQLLSGEVHLGSVLPEAASSIHLHCAVDSRVPQPTQ